ncbi:hypothetical protein GCM10022212_08920 [Actimicrobium antarcticum]|uniref:Ice-binding protein C-terminal domain-containing protein n=2 Tax=Actimicrobium antarcticum TaxID=1051899 RepID=A0ABP7SSU3_9BURK
MTKFTRIALGLSLMVSSSMMLSTAQATPAPSPSWIQTLGPATTGFSVGSSTVTYGPTMAQSVFSYDGANPPGNQSPAAIRTMVSTQFGLPSTGVGSLLASSAFGDISTGTFTIASSYDYLAIHYGKGELLFHWTDPIAANTSFTIEGLPRGISNYRAFSSTVELLPIPAVPEPETYGMLLAGLGLLGVVARRRKSA